MSWGLQFYEQNDLVNRAHFPDIYSKSMPTHRSNDSSDSNGLVIEEEENKEVIDWKYNHP